MKQVPSCRMSWAPQSRPAIIWGRPWESRDIPTDPDMRAIRVAEAIRIYSTVANFNANEAWNTACLAVPDASLAELSDAFEAIRDYGGDDSLDDVLRELADPMRAVVTVEGVVA